MFGYGKEGGGGLGILVFAVDGDDGFLGGKCAMIWVLISFHLSSTLIDTSYSSTSLMFFPFITFLPSFLPATFDTIHRLSSPSAWEQIVASEWIPAYDDHPCLRYIPCINPHPFPTHREQPPLHRTNHFPSPWAGGIQLKAAIQQYPTSPPPPSPPFTQCKILPKNKISIQHIIRRFTPFAPPIQRGNAVLHELGRI